MGDSLNIKPEAEVRYTEDRWKLLQRKRMRAKETISILKDAGLVSFVYGSIARGDVEESSDVDVVIPRPTLPHSLIEEMVSKELGDPLCREIVQATPQSTPKYYIYYSDNTTISMPIGRLREREEEFYKFGGMLDLRGITANLRVPGVSKELKLIYPTNFGHVEYPVVGNEEIVAKILGVSRYTVDERVRVLTKRRVLGTTGLYVNYRLQPDENFEEALRKLKMTKKGFRNRLSEEYL